MGIIFELESSINEAFGKESKSKAASEFESLIKEELKNSKIGFKDMIKQNQTEQFSRATKTIINACMKHGDVIIGGVSSSYNNTSPDIALVVKYKKEYLKVKINMSPNNSVGKCNVSTLYNNTTDTNFSTKEIDAILQIISGYYLKNISIGKSTVTVSGDLPFPEKTVDKVNAIFTSKFNINVHSKSKVKGYSMIFEK